MAKYTCMDYIKYAAEGCATLPQASDALEGLAKRLREMEAAGLQLLQPVDNGYIIVTTEDENLANKFGFDMDDDEDEEFDEDAEEGSIDEDKDSIEDE